MKHEHVRLGLYGCNPYRTKQLVDAAMRCHPGRVSITACFDIDKAKVDTIATEYKARPCYDLCSFQKAEYDVAVICLPPFLHPDAFVACAEAGKDVYLEKPVCVDEIGRDKLIAALERYKPVCYVGVSSPYIMPHRKALEIRRRPESGRFIACHHHRFHPSTGTPPAQLNWRHKLEQSGGELNQHCSHDMHYLRMVGGDPESVMAMTYTSSSYHPRHEEEELTACFRFQEGMAVFSLSQRSHRAHLRGHIHMENCAIQYDWSTLSRVRVYTNRPRAAEETYEWNQDGTSGHRDDEDTNVLQMRDFLNAYMAGNPMPITMTDGIQTYEMVKAIRESYRTRCEVSVPKPLKLE